MPTVISPGEDSDRSGGVGGAPPLWSIAAGTVPHYLPLCNTIPHFSVRRVRRGVCMSPVFGSRQRRIAGGERWDGSPGKPPFFVQALLLNANLRAPGRFSGAPCELCTVGATH